MSTRTLTVVFTDIVESTGLLVELGASDAEQVRIGHFGDLQEQIERFRGTKVKTLGDGMMAYFPSAGDALDCAIAMQQGTAARAFVNRRSISIRVGISTGDVRLDDGDCHGIAVVEASRVCAAAAVTMAT